MTNYISTKNMSRLDWLKARQNGIGGSDAPALMMPPKEYKWSRPKDVYESKVGEPDETSSLACRVGSYLEDFVARLFTEETGMTVHRYNRIMFSDEHPFMLANIDRKLYGNNIGLECKATSDYNEKKFSDDDYPYQYFFQIQHYMAVTGWDMWYLAVLIGNRKFRWYEVPRDEKAIQNIIKTESKFWNDVVVPRNTEELELWA